MGGGGGEKEGKVRLSVSPEKKRIRNRPRRKTTKEHSLSPMEKKKEKGKDFEKRKHPFLQEEKKD